MMAQRAETILTKHFLTRNLPFTFRETAKRIVAWLRAHFARLSAHIPIL